MRPVLIVDAMVSLPSASALRASMVSQSLVKPELPYSSSTRRMPSSEKPSTPIISVSDSRVSLCLRIIGPSSICLAQGAGNMSNGSTRSHSRVCAIVTTGTAEPATHLSCGLLRTMGPAMKAVLNVVRSVMNWSSASAKPPSWSCVSILSSMREHITSACSRRLFSSSDLASLRRWRTISRLGSTPALMACSSSPVMAALIFATSMGGSSGTGSGCKVHGLSVPVPMSTSRSSASAWRIFVAASIM